MDEITSFNQLFAEAKRVGVKLFSFHQLDNGDFVARWRRDHDAVFEAVRHERPFDAARDAFLLALSAVKKKEGERFVEVVQTLKGASEDLFG